MLDIAKTAFEETPSRETAKQYRYQLIDYFADEMIEEDEYDREMEKIQKFLDRK